MDEWHRKCLDADIAHFQTIVDTAPVVRVDEPTGRKDVEIAWEDSDGFHSEDGVAVAVYRDGDGTLKIDWTDERNRTIVQKDDIHTLEEGEYYTES